MIVALLWVLLAGNDYSSNTSVTHLGYFVKESECLKVASAAKALSRWTETRCVQVEVAVVK